MENATKALLMAAGVLMALLILGALILMFNGLTSYQNESVQTTREAQIVDFNNQYETYNRNDVRGSDLLSLLNKAIDYNQRKTSIPGAKGTEIAYEPMKITFKFGSTANRKKFSYDKTNRLFTDSYGNDYVESDNVSDFDTKIKVKTDALENTYGTDVIQKLSSSITGIYSATNEKVGLEKYNSIVSSNKKASSFADIKKDSATYKDICTYYEFTQFKRANFKCTGTKYNSNTGRITEMTLEFTGSFD